MKATTALQAIIAAEIERFGPIPFSRFMKMALYQPNDGYYSSHRKKTGKQGDFITSVSVGSCFGSILTRKLHSYWTEAGASQQFHIIEPGANDGTLAGDILDEAARFSPEFYQAIHYHLIETSEALRNNHSERLSDAHEGRFNSQPTMSAIHVPCGAVISNELIDALPVELVKFDNDQWNRQMVCIDANGDFSFTHAEIGSQEIAQFFASLGPGYPDGYTTEYNTNMDDFVRSASDALSSGIFITIDYGHTREDYYHPRPNNRNIADIPLSPKSRKPTTLPRRDRHHVPRGFFSASGDSRKRRIPLPLARLSIKLSHQTRQIMASRNGAEPSKGRYGNDPPISNTHAPINAGHEIFCSRNAQIIRPDEKSLL